MSVSQRTAMTRKGEVMMDPLEKFIINCKLWTWESNMG
jgi:hypothetical protein